MKRLVILAAVFGAVVAAGATTAMAGQSDVSAAPLAQAERGIEYLEVPTVDVPSDRWVNVMRISLPGAGWYEIDANVRGGLTGIPPTNTLIVAQLAPEAELPRSQRLVCNLVDLNAGAARIGGNQTAPISDEVQVNGPTDIYLQAKLVEHVGEAETARIYSNSNGRTSMRYERL